MWLPPAQVLIPASEPRQRSPALRMEICFLPVGWVVGSSSQNCGVLCDPSLLVGSSVTLGSAARLHIMKLFMQPKRSPDVCSSNGVLQFKHFEECLGFSHIDSLQMMQAKWQGRKVDFSDVP